MVYLKRDFHEQIASLCPEGFEKEESLTIFKRVEQTLIKRIHISANEYFPHSAQIAGVSIDVTFTEVEGIINPLLDKYKIEKRYGNTTISKSLQNIDGIDYETLSAEITNGQTFSKAANELRKVIFKGALPFFEKFSEIKKVSEQLSLMSEEEISNFISGIVGIKVPLIKKLAHAPDFQIELENRNRFYSSEALKYPKYFKDHEKVFNDLFADDLK